MLVQATEPRLARVMRVLDAHERECTGDVCVVHGVSMRAMEHAMSGIEENSVEAFLGGGASGFGTVVIRFVERDGRRAVESIDASTARQL